MRKHLRMLWLVGACVIAGLFPDQLIAQSPDTGGDPSAVAPPEPATLTPGWWRYVSASPPEDRAERISAMATAAETALLALKVEEASGASEALERFKAQLDALVRLQIQAPQDVLPALRMDGPFTPEQLFAVVNARLGIVRQIDLDAAEVQERRETLGRYRRLLEADFAVYLELDAASVQRLQLGIRVMAARAAVAVLELRLQRQETRLAQQRAHLRDIVRQQRLAVENLTFDALDEAALIARESAAEERAEDARGRIASADSRLTEISEDTPRARAEYRLAELEQTSAAVAEQQAMLDADVARVLLTLHEIRSADGATQSLVGRVDAWRDRLASLDERIETWRVSTSGAVLAPSVLPMGLEDEEVSRLERETQAMAQGVLTDLIELRARSTQLGLLLDELDELLARRAGGFRLWWAQAQSTLEGAFGSARDLMSTRMFEIGETPVTPGGLLRVLLILLVAYWISWALRHALERLGEKRTFMNASSIYTLGRLAHYVIMIGALLFALGSLGLDFSNLALIAGALSVGIGFGLQSIVSNFVSGLILLFERSLKVGDYVELDSGLTGHVREINIRSTRINTNDNIDVLVPNAEFVSTKLTNWTLREPMARMRIPFGVAYGTDKELVRKVALEAADRVDFTLRHMPGKEPEVWLVGFGDSSLDFELLVWVSRAGVRRPGRVQATYLWELHTLLEQHGIEIPFPQRDLHLRSGTFAAEPLEPPQRHSTDNEN